MVTVFDDVKRGEREPLTPSCNAVDFRTEPLEAQVLRGCIPLGTQVDGGEDASRKVGILRLHKSPRSRWSDEDPVPTIDRVCDLGREELAGWISAWFSDLEIMHNDLSDDLGDEDLDKLRQRTNALRRIMLVLDFKADVAEELTTSINGAQKRLDAAEKEVMDLRAQLQTAKEEIAELRANKSNLDGRGSENIKEGELLGSRSGEKTAEPWSVVVGRRAGGGRGSGIGPVCSPRTPSVAASEGPSRRVGTPGRGVGRTPRSPAVLIKSLDEGVSHIDMMRRVRDKVSPRDFKIEKIRCRETVNGGVLLEVLDPDAGLNKFDVLAGAIDAALGDCAIVSRPAQRAEFRLRGFDPSVSGDEIRRSVAEAGRCPATAVSVSDIRRLASGHRVAWVSCPAAVAWSLSRDKTLTIGWSRVSMDSVQIRKTQCYRCWQFGHVRGNCRAATDRSGHCFRCGEVGHLAGKRENGLSCVLCRDGGMDHAHRLGSSPCKSVDLPFMRRRT